MKKIRKWLLSICTAVGAFCFAFAGFGFVDKDAGTAQAEESGLVAYDVYGGSVRLVDDAHGTGIRFHVGMTLENFAKYGTIDGKKGVLNSNYQTGTLLLPTHLLNGKTLEVGGTGYNATLSDTDTSELWYKAEIGNVEYMQTVIYLYNIPKSDLGTEISVRGYVYDKSAGAHVYTDQLDTLSLSAVAELEYYDEDSKLTPEQKSDLKETYIDKTVTFQANGGEGIQRELDYNTPVGTAEKAATVANAEFVGWYKKDGVTPFDFTTPVKNDSVAYAIYRRDISIENGASLTDYIKDYTYTAIESAVYTAPGGSTYTLFSGETQLDLTALALKPQDHGEGTLKVSLQNGNSKFTVTLPVTVVTKYISTKEAFKETIQDKLSTQAVTGYYKLTANLGVSNSNYVSGLSASTYTGSVERSTTVGFQGTLNGQGYWIYSLANQPFGLFGVLKNATLKNLLIKDGYYSGGGYASILARAMHDTTLENVTINLIGGSANTKTGDGWLARYSVSGCTLRNVTLINSIPSTVSKIQGLFGTAFYAEKKDAIEGCTFENVVCDGLDIAQLGYNPHVTSGTTYYYTAPGRPVEGQTCREIPGIVVKTNTASATAEQQEIILTDDNALVLGDAYKDADILSVKLGNYDLGTDLENLEIPQNMISDGAVFGAQTVTVLANVNGVATTITVPVTVKQVESTAVTLENRQDLVMTDSTFALSLGTQYKTARVQSILLGSYNLGTNLSALAVSDALKADVQNHGEKDVTITATVAGKPYVFTVPVTLVTEEITDINRIWELRPKADNAVVYGYYKLANNVGSSTYSWGQGTSAPNNNKNTDGWRATLDGNGYSITYKSVYNGHGLFGEIGEGAVIKNVTINDYGVASHFGGSGFAKNIQGATIKNMVYNVCATINRVAYAQSGVLSCANSNTGVNNTTFENVVINAEGKTIASVFGGVFLPETCTFNNVYVYAETLYELGNSVYECATTAANATSITSVAGITVSSAPANVNVTLDGTQDIVLSKATNALDLGTYKAEDVQTITLTMGGVNYDLGTNVSKLAIPTEAVEAKDKHGNATVKVVLKDRISLATTTITINVLVVTRDITTAEELQEVFYMPTASTAYYGYYRLANDVGDSNFVFTNTSADHSWRTYGFRGTFDGNNKTITGKTGTRGIFGYINEGAVVKNVTINDKWYSGAGYTSVLASSIARATIENVTINHQGGEPTIGTAHRVGYLTYDFVYGSTFRNVTVNADGKNLQSLFGGYTWCGYEYSSGTSEQNTFENVRVNVAALGEIGHCDNAGIKVTSEEGILVKTAVIKAEIASQTVLVSAPSINLGEYQGLTIASIKSSDGKTNYGTNVSALANVTAGEQTLVVTGTIGVQDYEITVPVVFADGIITTMEQLEYAVRYYGTDKGGYYVLGNDVSYTESGFAWDKAASTAWSTSGGFDGTLDGNNHKITVDISDAKYAQGLFGSMNGTVKNVTISAVNANSKSKTILARVCSGTLENVTFEISGDATYVNRTCGNCGQCGAIVETSLYNGTNPTWTNVSVYSSVVINKLLPLKANIQNKVTFTNCTLSCPSFNSFYADETATTLTGWTVSQPVDVTLDAQAIALNAETKALDLGEYADIQPMMITAGGVSLGLNANALELPANFTAGAYTVTVFGTLNGKLYNIAIPVSFADGIITTMEELEAAVRIYTATAAGNKAGYYALGNDIVFNASALDKAAANSYNDVGFTGTLDGNGKTIYWNMGEAKTVNGIFGSLAGTAVVKNLTVEVTNYSIGYQKNVFANYSRAKFTDVTVNISGVGGTGIPGDGQYGALIGNALYSGAWTNVVVNSTAHLEGVFGTGSGLGATFTNCALNVPSYGILAKGVTSKAGLTITLTPSLTEREVWIDTDKSLDLGEYAGLTVTSIKTANGEYNFGANASALTIPEGITTGDNTLIVTATNGTINYKITVPVKFCSLAEATSIEITDVTEQAIDLGITNGVVNNDQTYTIALDGLSTYNFVSATINGKTFNTLTFNVNAFGKTFGETEMEITYKYGNETRTFTVPAVLATKVLKTASDINNWTAWADAYYGTTGDWIYDGYFVLGNDIDYNGKFETLVHGQADATGKPIEYAEGQEELGFRGTFDGRGYAIKNMHVSDTFNGTTYFDSTSPHTFEKSTSGKGTHYRMTAFITKMHKDGVLKNVAFLGGVADYSAYLVGWGEGLVENVYVKYTEENAWASAYVVTINNQSTYGRVTMKNSIIDITEQKFKNADTTAYFIIGQAIDDCNLYQNIFIVGEMPSKMVAVRYNNTDLQGSEDGRVPRGYDYFANYASVSEFLAENADTVNGWNYFDANATSLSINGNEILTATAVEKSNTKYFVNEDNTATDYVIVYDDRNDAAREAAGFIGKMFYRATGTVTYATSTTLAGTFSENVKDGIVLPRATTATWSDTACYIVIGDVVGMPVSEVIAGKDLDHTYLIQSKGNSVFIYAKDGNDYLAAAHRFLEETLGFRAYDDDVITFDYQDGITFNDSTFDIVSVVAFSERGQTNAGNPYKMAQRAINSHDFWSMGPEGTYQQTGETRVYGVHNTLFWLPYEEFASTHPKWYRAAIERTGANGKYNAYDVCYTANGNATERAAMVNALATKMVAMLDANPDKTALSFSMMDNYSMDPCDCAGCKAVNTANNTAVALRFLSEVATAIATLRPDREFQLYTLAYYYLLTAPTDAELQQVGFDTTKAHKGVNEHVGVLYAPVRVGVETLGLNNSANSAIYNDMEAWSKITDHASLWLYDTLFHNYMMPVDTFESMLNWLAYAVKIFGKDVAWVVVNGQSRQYVQTAFESFKAYTVLKAEMEIYEKVVKDGITDERVKAYLLELEQEFFNFTGSDTKTFKDGGYYGTAVANEAMYNMYSSMRTQYQTKRNGNNAQAYEGGGGIFGFGSSTTDMKGNTAEAYDYMKVGITGKYSYEKWLTDGSDKSCYFANFSKSEVNGYMNYLETAIASVNGLPDSNSMKKVYQQKVIIESLFPRFVIANGNHSSYWSGGFNHSGASYWTGNLTAVRTGFKADCEVLGITYYEEHGAMSTVFTKWGV